MVSGDTKACICGLSWILSTRLVVVGSCWQAEGAQGQGRGLPGPHAQLEGSTGAGCLARPLGLSKGKCRFANALPGGCVDDSKTWVDHLLVTHADLAASVLLMTACHC